MPLLEPIASRGSYIPGANNLGIVAADAGGAIAIDTGARRVRGALGLSLAAIPQYAIFVTAISARLGHQESQGLASATLEDARMIWRTVGV